MWWSEVGLTPHLRDSHSLGMRKNGVDQVPTSASMLQLCCGPTSSHVHYLGKIESSAPQEWTVRSVRSGWGAGRRQKVERGLLNHCLRGRRSHRLLRRCSCVWPLQVDPLAKDDSRTTHLSWHQQTTQDLNLRTNEHSDFLSDAGLGTPRVQTLRMQRQGPAKTLTRCLVRHPTRALP